MASLFSKPPTPKAGALIPDEKAINAAKKKSIAGQMKRSGRLSTLLSGSERLGN